MRQFKWSSSGGREIQCKAGRESQFRNLSPALARLEFASFPYSYCFPHQFNMPFGTEIAWSKKPIAMCVGLAPTISIRHSQCSDGKMGQREKKMAIAETRLATRKSRALIANSSEEFRGRWAGNPQFDASHEAVGGASALAKSESQGWSEALSDRRLHDLDMNNGNTIGHFRSIPRGSPMNHGTETLAPRPVRDPKERERVLLEHLPQVRYIARRIHDRLPAQVPLEDLIHAGVVGLIDAVEKFDPSKNVQLKSYAKFRIRGAILDSLRELDWSPRHLRRQARQIEEAHRDLKLRLGRIASEPELAAELGMSVEDFQYLLGELRWLDLGSLQTESSDTKSGEETISYKPGGMEKDPFFLCLRGEMKSLVATALEDLDEKERQVVTLYYLEELTMREVGVVLGVGESRVSQIHSVAIVRLRARSEEILHSRVKTSATPAARTLRKDGAYGKDPEAGPSQS